MRSNKRAFTIIESLVVIAIISIISGFMVANFRKGERDEKLQRSAQLIVQGIRKAQNMAMSTVAYQDNVYNYGLHFSRSSLPTSCEIFVDRNDNRRYNSGEALPPSITLEQGIIILTLSTGNLLDIVFIPPDPLTIFNNNTGISEVTITIIKEGGTCPKDCRYIKVNNKGWMSISKIP